VTQSAVVASPTKTDDDTKRAASRPFTSSSSR
jgi:hypothetical protein